MITTAKTSGGWNNVLVERDGSLGLGIGGVGTWIVGSPPLRIFSSGIVNVMSPIFYFGEPNGPQNASSLCMRVSNTNEWATGSSYPNGQNYYTFGTVLSGAATGARRAPLHIVADQLQFMTGAVSDSQRAVLTQAGNFGIGEPSPTAQLHTTGTVRFAGLTEDSTQTRVLVSDASGNLYYRSAASLAANDILRSSLAVNGTIKARELKLSRAGWADYVFDSTYSLMPLKEVNEYIRARRHLPGMPSAAEVARNGVDVGKTQVALLKKIEELTLYNIAQQKKIEEQEGKIELMQAQMKVMMEALHNMEKQGQK
ncbi:MAG TPA: hypothetical protein VGM31_04245 [Puia sp.]